MQDKGRDKKKRPFPDNPGPHVFIIPPPCWHTFVTGWRGVFAEALIHGGFNFGRVWGFYNFSLNIDIDTEHIK